MKLSEMSSEHAGRHVWEPGIVKQLAIAGKIPYTTINALSKANTTAAAEISLASIFVVNADKNCHACP